MRIIIFIFKESTFKLRWFPNCTYDLYSRQELLEAAHPGFAYQLLAVEIDIENIQENMNKNIINTLKQHLTNT